nr:hypothetical protein [Tanacetum cinerariifolium]
CKILGQILLDHPLSYALTATADVPAVYLQQFWKTFRKVPDTKDTIRFKMDTQDIIYTVDIFRDTLKMPVETLDNPFVAPVNIEIIESFVHTIGYQGFIDKKKDAIQYPRFTKLITTNLIKKYPFISLRFEEDYHFIKDDILLVSVYTTGNVTVQGMLIPDAFLTKEIHATDDYKEYETVFVYVDVLMNQPQLVVSTQGTHRTIPRAYRTLTLTASPQGKKRKQSARETSSIQKSLKVTIKQKNVVEGDKDEESYANKFVASMIHDDVDDAEDMIDPESHKEHPELVDDDDDKEKKKDDEMGSLENRTDKMQTPIPTTPRSLRINLSSDKNINQELTDTVSLSTANTSKDPHKKRHISSKYSHLPGALRRMDDEFHSQRHDDHQEDDAHPEGEKRVKRHKTSNSSKSARASSSK